MNRLPLLGLVFVLAFVVIFGLQAFTRAQETREAELDAYRARAERATRELPRGEDQVQRIVGADAVDDASEIVLEEAFDLGETVDIDEDVVIGVEIDGIDIEEIDIEEIDIDEDGHADVLLDDEASRVLEEAFDLTIEEDREVEGVREIVEDIEDDQKRKLKELERREIEARRDAKRAELQARKQAMQKERAARMAADGAKRVEKLEKELVRPLPDKELRNVDRQRVEFENLIKRKDVTLEDTRQRARELEALLEQRRALAEKIGEEQGRLAKQRLELAQQLAEKSLGHDADVGSLRDSRRQDEADALSALERISALRQASSALRRAGRVDMAARLEREAGEAERAARKARTFEEASASSVLEAVRDLHDEVRRLRADIQQLRESLAER